MKNCFHKYLPFIIFMCWCVSATAQSDTTKIEKKLDKKAIYGEARKASIMSAIVPGLGQAYNRKFWKIPILYAGLGGFSYLFVVNQKKFKFYSDNLRWENDNDPNTLNTTSDPVLNTEQLLSEKTLYRKRRDIGVIGIAIFYFLNIIDANVDAHLKTFDVSDDLSLNIKPYMNYTSIGSTKPCLQNGICLQLNFK